jgi:hypothetical protein
MDILYVKHLIQTILEKTFKETSRREINDYEGRLNFCCPICMDSATHASKKRGNVWINTLLYRCYNCGAKSSLDKLCKSFAIQMDPSKKLEMIEYVKLALEHTSCKSDMNDVDFSELLNLEDLTKVLTIGNTITDFKPIVKNGSIYKYLVQRGIGEHLHKDIYQANHWLNDDRYEPIIVLLNRSDNKILGIQTRNLKSGKYRSFKIYNFETLYKWIYTDEQFEELDINQVFVYNKLSYYFNILNIDFERTITIFEGFLDSLFYPNAIGIVGVNTNTEILENNNLDIQYFFDNDDAGFKKSEEKIKSGFKIFLWRKLFEDIVDKKNTQDPYTLLHRISKVKDLNKLAELVDNPYQKLQLDQFFSRDIFDLKWLPKSYITKKYTKS